MGDKLGAVLRIGEGETEGVVLDKVVGEALGAIDGLDGATDGVLLGGILGEALRAILGQEEGIAVEFVGFAVGLTVGFGYL